MRRYEFKLQSILNLKEKNLEDERLKLAGILNLLEEQNSVLNEMREKKVTVENELNSKLESSILDIQIITSYRNFITQIMQDTRLQLEIIEKTKNELEIQKLKVNEAYREVKVLEKLKEKQYQNYLCEYEQAQTKELDDITISRYKRAI